LARHRPSLPPRRSSDLPAGRGHALAHPGTHPVDPAQHLPIEPLLAADGEIDAPAILHQGRQQRIELADGKRLVGTVLAHRALLAGTPAVPQLALRISVAAEQNVLAL